MLTRCGHIEEVVAQAQQQIGSADEAIAVAQALRERGELEHALQIAEVGLALGGQRKYNLAVWTSELAEGMGQIEQALRARVMAFQTYPTLVDYLKVQELAGETQWLTLRQDLLTTLQNQDNLFFSEAKVDIFLHENLLDDAIATVDSLSSYQAELVQRVMDAAIPDRPDWVIDNARRRAESIMDDGKAKYYQYAIDWLSKVRAAYLQSGQPQVWQAYHSKLLQTHARKYKLMAMLQRL